VKVNHKLYDYNQSSSNLPHELLHSRHDATQNLRNKNSIVIDRQMTMLIILLKLI